MRFRMRRQFGNRCGLFDSSLWYARWLFTIYCIYFHQQRVCPFISRTFGILFFTNVTNKSVFMLNWCHDIFHSNDRDCPSISAHFCRECIVLTRRRRYIRMISYIFTIVYVVCNCDTMVDILRRCLLSWTKPNHINTIDVSLYRNCDRTEEKVLRAWVLVFAK